MCEKFRRSINVEKFNRIHRFWHNCARAEFSTNSIELKFGWRIAESLPSIWGIGFFRWCRNNRDIPVVGRRGTGLGRCVTLARPGRSLIFSTNFSIRKWFFLYKKIRVIFNLAHLLIFFTHLLHFSRQFLFFSSNFTCTLLKIGKYIKKYSIFTWKLSKNEIKWFFHCCFVGSWSEIVVSSSNPINNSAPSSFDSFILNPITSPLNFIKIKSLKIVENYLAFFNFSSKFRKFWSKFFKSEQK